MKKWNESVIIAAWAIAALIFVLGLAGIIVRIADWWFD